MDIKEAIKNIIHKHNQLEKPVDDSESDYIKKEEGELVLDREFEEDVHHIVDDLPPDYWRNNFSKGGKKTNLDTNIVGKKGRFYLYHGMRIDLGKETPESLPIIELMRIIRENHDKNDIFDKMADIKIKEDKVKKNQKTGLISMIKDISSSDSDGGSANQELEMELQPEKQEDVRSNTEHLRLEELYIQSVAVSLLAESDGNSSVAKEILFNGGMEAIKKMDVASLKTILDQLNDVVIEDIIEH
jgi:hypothetical protein